MRKKSVSFRVGKVQAYLRGQVWYLCYHENGQRRRPRVGTNREAARQLAAQVNAQLEVGAPAALSFEPISVPGLRCRWLEYHELVLRSSVRTIQRYRTATDHLLRYLQQRPVRYASQFHASHAEQFVRHLRSVKVSSNGHANTVPRPLMDKGLRFILECCRTLFNYAAKRRHLSPYAENPFAVLEIDRIPIEHARPVELFTPTQERALLEACDDWQLPLFLTLMLTGLRPGELCHLLLPDDLDLTAAVLRVRNKPRLGWQVKTRNERDVPLLPVLVEVLRHHVNSRISGPVFLRRCFQPRSTTWGSSQSSLERELERRLADQEAKTSMAVERVDRLRLARGLWREVGALREDRVRQEFLCLTRRIGLPSVTAPKLLRHQFATSLQEANVDPLIRNLLMGHASAGERSAGHGLGMTAVYTHTRPETIRKQLEGALAGRVALAVAAEWLRGRGQQASTIRRTMARGSR
jgi:integrase